MILLTLCEVVFSCLSVFGFYNYEVMFLIQGLGSVIFLNCEGGLI